MNDVCLNIVDIVVINAWIVFKGTKVSNMNRRDYNKKLVDELREKEIYRKIFGS